MDLVKGMDVSFSGIITFMENIINKRKNKNINREKLIQQKIILQKLQEEAEARGEHFDIQEYLAQLAEQSEEDDEIGNQEDKSDKFNKSF